MILLHVKHCGSVVSTVASARRSWVRFPAGAGPVCLELAWSPHALWAFFGYSTFPHHKNKHIHLCSSPVSALDRGTDLQLELVPRRQCWLPTAPRIYPLRSHTPRSYCFYGCQAFGASMALTVSRTALPGETCSNFKKTNKKKGDRRSAVCL